MKNLSINTLIFSALLVSAAPSVQAGQAVAAPTKPVYSKNLNVPEIQSDTRKLEAIVDNETAATSPVQPTSPPQTILVMPSAAIPQLTPVTPEIAPKVVQEPIVPSAQEANSWHEWMNDLTPLFAAFIALCAFISALMAGYYVYRAGVTSRRQLRAYVFITQTEINGVAAATQPVAQFVIRNTGQTPAQELVVFGNMVFEEFPLRKDLPVLVFSDPQLTKENLGSGGERYKWEYALTPLTEAQIAQMHAGTHALYIYGEIRYRDVFKKKRTTKYLYYTGGAMGIRDTILGGYPEGNEAI